MPKSFTTLLFLLLIVPVFFIAYPLLVKPGTILGGDFPYAETTYNSFKTIRWTWIENGIFNSSEIIPRYPIIGLLHIFASVNITSDIISKLMIIFGFFACSISFYFCSIHFFKGKINSNYDTKFKLAVIVGSLFYAYNVWSFHRMPQWYLWIAYALLPVFFISTIFSFMRDTRRWRYILASVMAWTIASSAVQMIIIFGLIFIGISILFVIINFRNKKRYLAELAKPVLLILSLYLLINSYWIYPYILSSREKEVAPSRVQTEEIVKLLSRDSNFLNVFRLIEDWVCCPRTVNVEPSQTSLLSVLWLPASFVIPILAFSSLLIKKHTKYVIAFSILAIIGIFLTLGYQAPINIWPVFLFYTPFLSSFNWIFREPDKWAFMIAFAYSFLISIVCFEVLKFSERIRYKNTIVCGFLILALGSIAVYSYPIYKDSLWKAYSPVVIPNDLTKLNNYLVHANDIQKFVFMPYTGVDRHTWSQGQLINDIFYQLSLVTPNISPSPLYYSLITDSISSNKTNNINNLIYPLGTAYLIYHNDTINPRYLDLLNKLDSTNGLKNIENIGFFKVFKAGSRDARELNIPKQNIVLIGGLDKFLTMNSVDSFSSIDSSLFFLDSATKIEKYEYAKHAADTLILDRNSTDNLPLSFVDDRYIISPFDATNHHFASEMWSKAGAMDPLHGPFHTYLNQFGIGNWDFDYGKGLVITWAKNSRLNIPLEVERNDNYFLYMRYLKNQQGGTIRLYLDNKLIKELITKDQSNKFTWENTGTFNLIKGKHYTLTLENVEGFNAVNIFALLPPNEKNMLEYQAHTLSNSTRNMFMVEAESGFYNIPTNDNNNNINPNFNGTSIISQKYGTRASNGEVLVLSPHSEIFTTLNILKPSNYVVALRAKTCATCTFLKISIGNTSSNVPLKNKEEQLKWLYFSAYLQPGENKLKIASDSGTDLDSVIVYSTNKKQETLQDVFVSKLDPPAKITEYKKIDPTKYVVKVEAKKSHLLVLAEPYDPLWVASIDNKFNVNSIPIYSTANGFYINRTGEYTLTIEYQAQKWFTDGLTISIATIAALAGYLIWKRRKYIITILNRIDNNKRTATVLSLSLLRQWRKVFDRR